MSSSSQQQPRYYDSHGDYQADDASGYFSTSTSLPLYQEQDSLPKFPVNSIETTIEKLKPSCLALVQNDQERKDFLKACQEFPKQAKNLQHLLEDRAKHQDNWLQSWWNKIGYLTFRDPSPINVNYIFNFPKTNKRCNAIDPLKRGAKLMHSVLKFSELVLNGQLPQDKFGKQQTPLCSSMYKYMFYSCRIPKQGQDLYRVYNHKSQSKHAIVSARGHYFSVDLVDPTNGRPYSVRELEVALEECREQAVALEDNSTSNVWKDLGILTTANRDEWTDNRNFLMNNVRGMEEAMRQLESGLILLCLESEDINPTDSLSQNSKTYLMGTQGRWYDKSYQFIMTPSGNLGLNGEHSMMDGMPAVRLQDFILEQEAKDDDDLEIANISASPPAVKPIFASPTISIGEAQRDNITTMKERALGNFDKTRNSLDIEVQSFQGYGSNWIKKHGKCSPDAFVQMVIQLAMGKLSTTMQIESNGGKTSKYVPMATYESTQIRPFKYGRTETTRSVSIESAQWVEAMLNRSYNDSEQVQSLITLFHKATDAHVNFIRNASQGLGIDRHLFGLQMIFAEQQDKGTEPSLFQDPLFQRSKQWLVSTSTLPSNPGFGPVVIPHGVGIAYDLRADHVYFTCTTYTGSAAALSHYLEESLLEIKELMLAAEGHGQSKL